MYDYVASDSGSILIFDSTDPHTPTYLKSVGGITGFLHPWPMKGDSIAIDGGYAFVGGCLGWSAIGMADVSDPAAASVVTSYDPQGCPYGLDAQDGYLFYVGDYRLEKGLAIVDVSIPDSPVEVGHLTLATAPFGIDVSGSYAYLANGGLRIIDISDREHPQEVGIHNTPASAWDVSVDGSYAYMADGGNGVRVIDVSDPTAPAMVCAYDTLGNALDTAVSGDYVYVADGDGGLVILRLVSGGPTPTTTPTPMPTRTPTTIPGTQSLTLQNGLNGYAGVTDTWIDEWQPTQNYHTGSDANFIRLYADGHQNTLIRFDLSSLPAGSTVAAASLELKIGSRTNTNPLTAEIYRLTRAWIDDEATWQLASADAPWEVAGAGGSADHSGDSEAELLFAADGGTWVSADVTDLVQYWLDHPSENYGALLRADAGGGVQYALRASDHPEQADHPKLVVQYFPATTTPTATATPTETATSSPTVTHTPTATPSPTATSISVNVMLPMLTK